MITHNFDFTAFYKRRKESRLAPNKKPSAQWLTWLIGFAERDGSFIVTNRGDLMFVITQNNYNIEILHEIQRGLGVGRVIIQSKALNASRYTVQDQIGLSLIVSLFNGNLILPSRQIGFEKFITGYNNIIDKPRIRAPIRTIPKIQLINKTPTFFTE